MDIICIFDEKYKKFTVNSEFSLYNLLIVCYNYLMVKTEKFYDLSTNLERVVVYEQQKI